MKDAPDADNEQVSRGVATHPGEGMSIKPLVHFHCVLHEKYGWGDIQLFFKQCLFKLHDTSYSSSHPLLYNYKCYIPCKSVIIINRRPPSGNNCGGP